MIKTKPLSILFISGSGIGLLIEHELREKHHPEDRVVSVEFPQECKKLMIEGKYDLLITGGRIQGNGEAGLELTRFAKESCPAKVLMMSIWTSEAEALAAGADRHWDSSSNISELVEIINELFPA